MALTYRTVFSGGGTVASADRVATFTPAVGDLLVVFVLASANTNTAATMTDDNVDGLGAYTLITTAQKATSADTLSCFVRNSLVGSATVTNLTAATGSNSSATIVVAALQGGSVAGSAAVVQSARQENRASATTPAVTFAAAVDTANVTVGAVGSASGGGSVTPPASWAERFDGGEASPNSIVELVTRNATFTGTTITWGSTVGSANCAIALELRETSGAAAYTLAATGGAYVVTGTAATLTRGRPLTALGGAYLVSGTPANAWAAVDPFSYTVAALLNTQAGGTGWASAWSAPSVFVIQTASAGGAGGQSVGVVDTAGAFGGRFVAAAASGTLQCRVRLTSTAGMPAAATGGPGIILFDSSPSKSVRVYLASDGTVRQVTNEAVPNIPIGTWALNTWLTIAIEWDGPAHRFRVQLAGGPWGAWRTSADGTAFVQVDLFGLQAFNSGTFEVDDVTAPAPAGTDLRVARRLSALGGAYTVTGTAATLTYTTVGAYTLTALGGAYSVTGTAATLTIGRTVAAVAGAYTVTGTAATLRLGRRVQALGGAYPVTGTAATLTVGRKVAALAGAYAVTGTAATLTRGLRLTALGGTYALTGTAAGLRVARRLSADAGVYAITGTAATLTYTTVGAYTLPALAGAYSVTGTAATLTLGRRVQALGGAYAVTGTAAPLTVGRRVQAVAGAYAVTGTAASLAIGRRLSAVAGAYAVTGTAATLVYTTVGAYVLVGNAGAYTLTGMAAGLRTTRRLVATGGAYLVTGTAAGLSRGRFVPALAGAYAVTGTAATFRRTYRVTAVAGAYLVSGTAATLVYVPSGQGFQVALWSHVGMTVPGYGLIGMTQPGWAGPVMTRPDMDQTEWDQIEEVVH